MFHSKMGTPPFKYLGLLMSENLKKERILDPLINLVSNRLASWINIFMSIEGKVDMLNSMLNSIQVFLLSFMNMSISVWKKLVGWQSPFL